MSDNDIIAIMLVGAVASVVALIIASIPRDEDWDHIAREAFLGTSRRGDSSHCPPVTSGVVEAGDAALSHSPEGPAAPVLSRHRGRHLRLVKG